MMVWRAVIIMGFSSVYMQSAYAACPHCFTAITDKMLKTSDSAESSKECSFIYFCCPWFGLNQHLNMYVSLSNFYYLVGWTGLTGRPWKMTRARWSFVVSLSSQQEGGFPGWVGCNMQMFTLTLQYVYVHTYITIVKTLRQRYQPQAELRTLTCLVTCAIKTKQNKTHLLRGNPEPTEKGATSLHFSSWMERKLTMRQQLWCGSGEQSRASLLWETKRRPGFSS